MSRKKKSRLRTATAVIAFILLLPFMIAAAAASVPSAEQTIFFAASTSAFLSAGDFFPEEKSADTAGAEVLIRENADKSSVPVKAFSVDDSEMLSYGVIAFPNSTDEERVVLDKSYDVGPEPYPESLESHDGVISSVVRELKPAS